MYLLYRDPVCTDLLAIHTHVPVTSVFCLFLIKTFLPPTPTPRFPTDLLHVSKYVRTPPLVKSGFEWISRGKEMHLF